MKSNDDKCHLIVCNQKDVSITLSVELLGVNIDTNLNFNEHVTNLCKKSESKTPCASQKYLNI